MVLSITATQTCCKMRIGSLSQARRLARAASFCAKTFLRVADTRARKGSYTWLREDIVDMGPVYIKIGQILSARPDVIPYSIAKQLESLQSNVPHENFETVCSVFKEDIGADMNEYFLQVDRDPIASASIGQVHRAIYKGHEVVIKVQRPNVREAYSSELDALELIATSYNMIDPLRSEEMLMVLKDLRTSMSEETDFMIEKSNMDVFREIYEDSDIIVVPRTVKAVCSTRILTMEYLPSTKITELYKMDVPVSDTEKVNIAEDLLKAFLDSLVNHGWMHCDPHPGNIGMNSEGLIVLYDFGIVGRVDNNLRTAMRELVFASYNRSIGDFSNALIKGNLIVSKRGIELTSLDVAMLDRLTIYLFEYMDTLDIRKFIDRLFSDDLINVEDLPFKVNNELFFLIRSFGILEGVCRSISPQFQYSTLVSTMMFDMMDVQTIMVKAKLDLKSMTIGTTKDQETLSNVQAVELRVRQMTYQMEKERVGNKMSIAMSTLMYIITVIYLTL